jgi:hypothetical protein
MDDDGGSVHKSRFLALRYPCPNCNQRRTVQGRLRRAGEAAESRGGIMDLKRLFGRPAKPEKRGAVIGAVRNVLNFFTLAILIPEAILAMLVASATGDQRTILIYGMLGIFPGVIVIFAVLVLLRPQLFFRTEPSPVSTAKPDFSDFLTGFFKNDAEFFNQMRKVGTRTAEAAQNLKAEKLTVIHYIRNDFQIGFRAYQGLFPTKRDRDGILPLVVATDRAGRRSTVDYFEWDDDRSSPASQPRTAAATNATPTVTVSENGPRNLSIFQFYKDPDRPGDWFLINPFSLGPDVILDHHVVVRNEDLSRWNPNKFIFEVRSDGTISFSSAVYTTAPHQRGPASSNLTDACHILSRFSAIPISARANNNFRNVKEHIDEIFQNDSFKADVTVFSLARKADETNLVLAYIFPE